MLLAWLLCSNSLATNDSYEHSELDDILGWIIACLALSHCFGTLIYTKLKKMSTTRTFSEQAPAHYTPSLAAFIQEKLETTEAILAVNLVELMLNEAYQH